MDDQNKTHDERTEDAMREAGVATSTGTYVDYFDFDEREEVMLPDGVSSVTIQVLNEGARRKYLNATNKDVTIARATGDARMKIASGDDRHALLEAAIVDWNLMSKDPKTGEMKPVPFDARKKTKFLEDAPTSAIDAIEKEVRKHNPWLTAEVSVEDIDEQIAELEELKETKLAEEEGKGLS